MIECEHGEDGKPVGHPFFRCAWPECPMGVPAPGWAVHYGAHGETLEIVEFERKQHVIDDELIYRWERR